MKNLISSTLQLNSGNPDEKRAEIRTYFLKTWEIDELLYSQLSSDAIFYHRGDPLRHIILFYLGHTAVFYINKFFLAHLIHERINPAFESIFAIGVDEMSWDDLNEKHYDWPQVEQVRKYRNKAKELILKVIDTLPIHIPITWEHDFWIVLMGIEHERIHLETSSVLIRQLALSTVLGGKFGTTCQLFGNAPSNTLIAVNKQQVTLGKPTAHPYYGWDNEYGSYTEQVEACKASAYLVSNQEFKSFVDDGGYHQPAYWTEEGWNWRSYKNAVMPLFWRISNNQYALRLVAEEIPMPWNWPVEVNYLEAKAFCNWKTAKTGQKFRLPTEAEWYAIAQQSKVDDDFIRDPNTANIGLRAFASPCPVDLFKMGDFYDVVGNVWQWTETPISGFAGFKVHPLYDDFSTPTFDGKHNLIKGGSWISTGNEATMHARYAFRRHFYQHAGFRYVQSENEPIVEPNTYETDLEVAIACEANWGDHFQLPFQFSTEVVGLISKVVSLSNLKVLNLNANTGRLAFELAKAGAQVTAIDFSARFIRMPIQLQQKGFMRYIATDEGDLLHYREVVIDLETQKLASERILFMQDNANNLKPIYSGYDLIILPNVLEQLLCPNVFLQHIHERLNAGGILAIVSTYDWKASKIDPKHWPGGFKKDGEPVTSLDGISELLTPQFDLISKTDNIQRLQALTSRKQTLELNELTIWALK